MKKSQRQEKDMQCSNCPDREVCYHFSSIDANSRDYRQLKKAYLRTLRCRRQRFG
jgi:hypothetical protein